MDLSHLNGPQAEAVRTTEGPLLVLAGAGSGKTRVIAHRVAYLLASRRVPARHILAVTFTNKAAAEMRERIDKLTSKLNVDSNGLLISTFHSFGMEVLRLHGSHAGIPRKFAIADAGDQMALIKRCMKEVRIDDRAFDPRRVLSQLSRAKNEGRTPEAKMEGLGDDYDLVVAEVWPRYQLGLRALGMVDFDDLIVIPGQLLAEHESVRAACHDRWRYLLVDEYQDTSRSQFQLMQRLAGLRRNVCVVGDDDQSIYAWRGAEVDNILGFDKHFPGAREVFLEQNYRSTANILAAANAVIVHNTERKQKKLWCDQEPGRPIELVAAMDDEEEARFIASDIRRELENGRRRRDIAILYRTSAQSRPVEEALRGAEIAYSVSGGAEFFDRREVKDLIAYLRACTNPSDELAIQRIINVPPRGIGDVTVDRLARISREQKVPLWELMSRADGIAELPTGAGKRVLEFVRLLERYRARMESGPAGAAARSLVDELGLREEIKRSTASLEAAARRISALDQLLDGIESHSNRGRGDLMDYLRLITLDTREEEEAGDAVTLTTLHAAKGLEWPVVYLCGCEEDLLPHKGMQGESQNLEEERRLAYVAITRARERLVMSRAKGRMFRGKVLPRTPSRFLSDLPAEVTLERDLDLPPVNASPETERLSFAQLRERLKARGQPR